MRSLRIARLAALTLGLPLFAFSLASTGFADDPPPAESVVGSESARRALAAIEVPAGFTKELLASEPLVIDPVAFCFDPAGNIYVAETARQERGVEDNRSSSFWLLDDLALATVGERRAMYEKWRDRRVGGIDYYRAHADRVRRLSDDDDDGRLETARVFSGGYDDPLDGTGAGVLFDDGALYYTNIPSLYRLPDADGDGHADAREVLSTGYGVRTALRGHDMHGLVIGPDRRLYWSIGDRGFHVERPDGAPLRFPSTGAVFRSELDGSGLTVLHTGLRNPQELAFDDDGNLFTVDNNSDGGDRARVVHIVRGGDSGWQMEYQTLEGSNRRGPWNQERLWWTAHDGQPAWIVPPVAHLTSGPSGLTYDLGWSLPERYRDHFFVCDFVGGAAGSKVRSFAVEEVGAGFRMVDDHVFVDHVLCTDVDFAPDGRLVISDWGAGWVQNGEGRLIAVADPAYTDSLGAADIARTLADGFDRPLVELAVLLSHVDRRVRFGAQWAIAELGASGEAAFRSFLRRGDVRIQRHALWGLGQCGRRAPLSAATWAALVEALGSEASEVRAIACQVIAEIAEVRPDAALDAAAFDALVPRLEDPAGRVVARAAEALGQLRNREAIAPLLACARRADDADPTLRIILAHALATIGEVEGMLAALDEGSFRDSASVRRVVLLALRGRADERITRFLSDADPTLVTEAARAIHDVPIPAALPALADLAPRLTTGATLPSRGSDAVRTIFTVEVFDLPPGAIPADVDPRDDTFLADKPRLRRATDLADSGKGIGDHYLARMTGTLVISEPGPYRFALSSDDQSVLFIAIESRDGTVGPRREIARIDGWVPRDTFEGRAGQVSAAVNLAAGARVHLEARQVEGGGGDHLQVAWQLPDGSWEKPIGGGAEPVGNVPLLRRVIAAALACGDVSHARALIALAADPGLPTVARSEALASLAEWITPGVRDRVQGEVRATIPGMLPVESREVADLRETIAAPLLALARDGRGEVGAAAVALAIDLEVPLPAALSLEIVTDEAQPVAARLAALEQLARLSEPPPGWLDRALASDRPTLRVRAREFITDGAARFAAIDEALANGPTVEQQGTIASLAKFEDRRAAERTAALFDRFLAGDLPPELALDIVWLGEARTEWVGDARWARYRNTLPEGDELAPYRVTLFGGDRERGRRLFREHPIAQCSRCHLAEGDGGVAGPSLDGIASRESRAQLLESIILPSARIVPGYESSAGAPSAMPQVHFALERGEIRDLVEYLSGL